LPRLEAATSRGARRRAGLPFQLKSPLGFCHVEYVRSNKYEYYLTLYDVDIDREIPNELIKFEKMLDKITEIY
jgi:hypothetical protein